MADYAYLDEERTKIIKANDPNIVKYKSVRCYCKNPICDARMFICKPEHPQEAYFRASGNPKHNGSCGSECDHFDFSKYDPAKFHFPEALIDLETIVSGTSGKSGGKSTGATTGLKPLKSVKEIYRMATNIPPEDKYAGIKIGDLLVDIRNYVDYSDGLEGYKLAECNFYCYEPKDNSIIMNFPFFPKSNCYLRLNFEGKELFDQMVPRLMDSKHTGIIVVSGLWKKIYETYRTKIIKAECTIKSEKQIGIIKKGK